MTTHDAKVFIQKGLEDIVLREHLNNASSSSEIYNVLAGEKLMFTQNEFEEAFHYSLTQCQTAEKADQLGEFKM